MPGNIEVYCAWTCMQAASFNYDMLYKVSRAISDEVRAKVNSYQF